MDDLEVPPLLETSTSEIITGHVAQADMLTAEGEATELTCAET